MGLEETISVEINECLKHLEQNGKVHVRDCIIKQIKCKDIKSIKGPGVYIFIDTENNKNKPLYVGEANNIARRVGNEHCKARIGASEGVARFLMHLLDEVCKQADDWRGLTVVNREEYIRKNVLMPMIERMEIIVITCPQLENPGPRKKNEARLELEDCLIDRLKPLLQQ